MCRYNRCRHESLARGGCWMGSARSVGIAVVPWWFLLVLIALSAIAVTAFLVLPAYRWLRSLRIRRVVDEVAHSLQMPLPEFLMTRRRVLADRLSNDPAVLEVVESLVPEREVPRDALMKQAYKIAYDTVPSFNPAFYFRLGYWLARAGLRTMYRVRLGYQDSEALRQISEDDSLLFLMNHRTNMDYVMVTYLTAQRSMMSYGVGEWARVWPIKPLLRAAGCYFLRRESHDRLYRTILARYIQMATEARVPHAIFPEGRLSRDGGLQSPRLGLLNYVTRNFDPVTSPDLVILPIGTNYDSVPEEKTVIARASESFVNRGRWFVWRSGAVFLAGTMFRTLLLWRRPFGYGCANFGTPISFKNWLRSHWVDWRTLSKEERFAWLEKFGEDFMADISRLIPVLPSSVLCTVLVEANGQPLDEQELRDRMSEAWQRFEDAGARIYLPGNSQERGIAEAMDMLKSRRAMVRARDGRWSVPAKRTAWVAYCANSVAHYLPDTGTETP